MVATAIQVIREQVERKERPREGGHRDNEDRESAARFGMPE
jgi:hypothetical protein